jgi:hypothetical protein
MPPGEGFLFCGENGVHKLIIAAVSAGALLVSAGFALADTTSTTDATTTTTSTPMAATPATVAAPAPAAPTQTAANAGDEMVCRTMPPPTGTRFGGRHICKTANQWAQEQAQAQHDLSKQEIQIPSSVRGN